MITMTLGTIPFPFQRAVNWLSSLLERGIISEPVIVQSGFTDVSLLAKYPFVTTIPMLRPTNLTILAQESRLVISHAGQGSTRHLASLRAKFILLPRLARYGEHIDDHQLYFAQTVEKMGVRYCLSLEELENYIMSPPPPFPRDLFKHPKLVDHLLKLYPPDSYQFLASELKIVI